MQLEQTLAQLRDKFACGADFGANRMAASGPSYITSLGACRDFPILP
jgi:hypothetical protein